MLPSLAVRVLIGATVVVDKQWRVTNYSADECRLSEGRSMRRNNMLLRGHSKGSEGGCKAFAGGCATRMRRQVRANNLKGSQKICALRSICLYNS